MGDQIRNIDELTDAILNLVRSEQGNALNEVNKKLAAWAAIFGVGTFIAGVYGMNFTLVPRDQTLYRVLVRDRIDGAHVGRSIRLFQAARLALAAGRHC